MNPFQKALLDSMEKEFDYVPAEEDLMLPRVDIKKRRSRVLQRVLAVAAIAALLMGATYAAVHFTLKVNVDEQIFYAPDGRIEGNRFEISFSDYILNEDAPDEIETFMAPTLIANKDTLSISACHLEDEDAYWFPHNPEYIGSQVIDGKIQGTWLDYYIGPYSPLVFRQMTLASLDGRGTLNYHYESLANGATASYNTFTIGNHEIFDLIIDHTNDPLFEGAEEQISHQWFWTDGDYLYELSAMLDEETMREIFESIRPVDDIYAYLETDAP